MKKGIQKISYALLTVIFGSIGLLYPLSQSHAQVENIIPSNFSLKQPYGGSIFFTIDASDVSSCFPPNPFFPIALLVRCILQVPFVIHAFNNYATTTFGDAFDSLRDNVLEPIELQQAELLCERAICSGLACNPSVSPASPYTGPVGGVMSLLQAAYQQLCPLASSPNCITQCSSFVRAAQAGNVSPAGLFVEIMKKLNVSPVTPGIVIILFPDQGVLPTCRGYGFVLGIGLSDGSGMYFTQRGDPAGDTCRGPYYLLGI